VLQSITQTKPRVLTLGGPSLSLGQSVWEVPFDASSSLDGTDLFIVRWESGHDVPWSQITTQQANGAVLLVLASRDTVPGHVQPDALLPLNASPRQIEGKAARLLRIQKLERETVTAVNLREAESKHPGEAKLLDAMAAHYHDRYSDALRVSQERAERLSAALEREKSLQRELMAQYAATEAASQRAIDATRAKSAFLAQMSHELRTPLNVIIGYAELLEEEMEDDKITAFVPDVQKIHSSARHLLALINDVLDLSKIEAGRTEIHPTCFSLQKLVTDALELTRPLAQKHGNTMRADLPDNLPLVTLDEQKLKQCLLNLLSNANKFTKDGHITIQVQHIHHVNGPDVEIIVSDTGIGIAPHQMGQLFEPFAQADKSIYRKFGGTGLGLSITRHFCGMMGGEVTVSSEAGIGSQFRMVLPAHLSPSEGDLNHDE
jgi:signal transduction histidine kinase